MDYSKIYNQLISKAQNRTLQGYNETHHIIPKCIGGKDTDENLVKLTAKEHFLAHKLLVEIYPNEHKLLWALWMMAIGKKRWKGLPPYHVTSRDYERTRLKVSESKKGTKISERHKQKIGKRNSKKVIQYDFQGNKIAEFPSAIEAERYINNKPGVHWKELHSNIVACCKLKQKSAYGYIWKFEGELLHLEEHKGSSNNFAGKKVTYQGKTFSTKKSLLEVTGMSEYMFYKLKKEDKIQYECRN